MPRGLFEPGNGARSWQKRVHFSAETSNGPLKMNDRVHSAAAVDDLIESPKKASVERQLQEYVCVGTKRERYIRTPHA